MLAGKNKWRQSGPKEIKLRNGGGRGVNFPDLLSYKLLFGENEAQRKKWAGSKWWRALKASPELFVITEIKHLDDWSLHPDIWHYPNTGLRILRFKKNNQENIIFEQRSRNIWIWFWISFPRGTILLLSLET